MEKITVVFLLWGNWGETFQSRYVTSLQKMLKKHLSIPYDLIGFVDKPNLKLSDCGIECREIPENVLSWDRNLPKFWVHSPDAGLEGRVLLFDLDMLIIKNIDEMASYQGDFCGIKPFRKRFRHMGGGFLSYLAGGETSSLLWGNVSSNPEYWSAMSQGGKERLVLKRLIQKKDYWQDLYPGQLVSYKRQLGRGSIMPDADVGIIAFHGDPRMHTIPKDKIIRKYWL